MGCWRSWRRWRRLQTCTMVWSVTLKSCWKLHLNCLSLTEVNLIVMSRTDIKQHRKASLLCVSYCNLWGVVWAMPFLNRSELTFKCNATMWICKSKVKVLPYCIFQPYPVGAEVFSSLVLWSQYLCSNHKLKYLKCYSAFLDNFCTLTVWSIFSLWGGICFHRCARAPAGSQRSFYSIWGSP